MVKVGLFQLSLQCQLCDSNFLLMLNQQELYLGDLLMTCQFYCTLITDYMNVYTVVLLHLLCTILNLYIIYLL